MVILVPVFTLMTQSNSGTIHNRNEILARQYTSNVIAYCNLIPFNDSFLDECEDKTLSDLKLEVGEDGNNDVNLENIEESFKNIIVADSKKISVKNYTETIGNWVYKYKVVTVKLAYTEKGKTDPRTVEMTGLVTEK